MPPPAPDPLIFSTRSSWGPPLRKGKEWHEISSNKLPHVGKVEQFVVSYDWWWWDISCCSGLTVMVVTYQWWWSAITSGGGLTAVGVTYQWWWWLLSGGGGLTVVVMNFQWWWWANSGSDELSVLYVTISGGGLTVEMWGVTQSLSEGHQNLSLFSLHQPFGRLSL